MSGGSRILVLSGEASGDRLGAHLVQAIRERVPDAEFLCIVCEAMERSGVQRIYDSGQIAVTGIVEVLGAWRSIWKAWRTARANLRSARRVRSVSAYSSRERRASRCSSSARRGIAMGSP